MYNYSHYKEPDLQKIFDFMRAHPFAMVLAAGTDGRVEATQVPVLVEQRDEKIFITGHIARKSDHQRALEESGQALVIFTGPHTYVSGTWYSSNPKQASTWNYIAVHARGPVRWTDDQGLVEILRKLSMHFEDNNSGSSTVYDNLPADYRDKLVKAIVGFELEVTELDNVHKLSQNRDEVSYDNIVKELRQREGDAREIGEIMHQRKSSIFPL